MTSSVIPGTKRRHAPSRSPRHVARRFAHYSAISLLALSAVACSSDSSSVTDPVTTSLGSFSASLSGAAIASLKGPSAVFYAPASGTLGAAYLIRMADSTTGAGIGIELDNISSLTPSAYDVGIEANQATFLFAAADGVTAYDGTSGTVVITSVTTDGLVTGTFTATALSRVDGTSTVTVAGSFTSAPTILYNGS